MPSYTALELRSLFTDSWCSRCANEEADEGGCRCRDYASSTIDTGTRRETVVPYAFSLCTAWSFAMQIVPSFGTTANSLALEVKMRTDP